MPKKLVQLFSNRAEFEIALDAIREDLIYIDLNFGIFTELEVAFAAHERAFRHNWPFWGMTRDAYLACAVLALCRVYDDHSQANSLPNLLLALETSRNLRKADPNVLDLFPGGVTDSQFKEDLDWFNEKNNPLVHRMRQWRRYVLAHNNTKKIIKGEKIAKADTPQFDDLPALISRAFSIVSRYGVAFLTHELNSHYAPRGDISFVFGCIQDRVDRQLEEARSYLRSQGVNPDVFLDAETNFESSVPKG